MFIRQVLSKSCLGISRRQLISAKNSLRFLPGPTNGTVTSPTRRHLSFSFTGPKKLDDIVEKDTLENKDGEEISDIWYTYHESRVRGSRATSSERLPWPPAGMILNPETWNANNVLRTRVTVYLTFQNIKLTASSLIQENVHGLVYKGRVGKDLLARAKDWYVYFLFESLGVGWTRGFGLVAPIPSCNTWNNTISDVWSFFHNEQSNFSVH